jgi:hypothetical protein
MRQPSHAAAAFKILRSAIGKMQKEVHGYPSWNGNGG